jgi:hypothetical protein
MVCLETNSTLYYSNIRPHYRRYFIDNLPNDETAWINGFRQWLAEQGCTVIRTKTENEIIVVDPLGIAPGHDRLCFDREQDATLFVLKWS